MGDKRTAKSKREKRVLKTLDNSFVLAQLLALANKLEVTVRQEKGDFLGGSCRIEEDRVIFLRKTDQDAEKIEVLMRELIKLDSSQFEIDSTLRDHMNKMRKEMNDNNVAV